MTVSQAFGRYLERLDAHEARVVSKLRDPVLNDDLRAGVAVIGEIPGDLVELWKVHDGTPTPRSAYANRILPTYALNSSAEAVEHRLDRSWPDGRWDLLVGETGPLDGLGVLVPVFEYQGLIALMIDLSSPQELLLFDPAMVGYVRPTGLTIEALFDAASDLYDRGWIVVDDEGCVTTPTNYPGPPPDVVPDIIGYTEWPTRGQL